jgi:hypothetical protein
MKMRLFVQVKLYLVLKVLKKSRAAGKVSKAGAAGLGFELRLPTASRKAVPKVAPLKKIKRF